MIWSWRWPTKRTPRHSLVPPLELLLVFSPACAFLVPHRLTTHSYHPSSATHFYRFANNSSLDFYQGEPSNIMYAAPSGPPVSISLSNPAATLVGSSHVSDCNPCFTIAALRSRGVEGRLERSIQRMVCLLAISNDTDYGLIFHPSLPNSNHTLPTQYGYVTDNSVHFSGSTSTFIPNSRHGRDLLHPRTVAMTLPRQELLQATPLAVLHRSLTQSTRSSPTTLTTRAPHTQASQTRRWPGGCNRKKVRVVRATHTTVQAIAVLLIIRQIKVPRTPARLSSPHDPTVRMAASREASWVSC